MEELPEAVQLADRLPTGDPDLLPALHEERHGQGFTGVSAGGRVWTIVADKDAPPDGTPPADIYGPILADLQMLNARERQIEAAASRVSAERMQLFADWCKYLAVSYPGSEGFDPEPRPDTLRALIEAGPLAALKRDDITVPESQLSRLCGQ
ncbi:hypothetical protein FNJ84_13470 [Paracoccus sp. M683]|uniref:hypothetical protein n=1 Tax=Paracoccus sp. M683 TaxID=2594268 RepID=UPI00118120DD|nr:hypothetical protein [Paracoccus sp. M683]TRW96287.1 hypothetical protein FNJ84_13470 [Paracoccus sp. M683]